MRFGTLRFCVTLFACFLGFSAAAQVAIPVDPNGPRNRVGRLFGRTSIYAEAGPNLVVSRRIRNERIDAGSFIMHPGWRAGFALQTRPRSGPALLLGLDYLRDRAERTEYRNETVSVLGSNGVTITNSRAGGKLVFDEQYFRLRAGLGWDVGPVHLIAGLAYVAPISSRSARYSFERTFVGFIDEVTGEGVLLAEPVITQERVREVFQREYLALLAGISYGLGDRWRLALDYDGGIYLGNPRETRTRNHRLGLTLGYDLTGARER